MKGYNQLVTEGCAPFAQTQTHNPFQINPHNSPNNSAEQVSLWHLYIFVVERKKVIKT